MSKRAHVEADVFTDDHVEIKGGRAKAEAECTPLHALHWHRGRPLALLQALASELQNLAQLLARYLGATLARYLGAPL